MESKLQFLAIGDVVTDAFIRLKEAKVTCDVDEENCTISMAFGDKVPYEFVEVVKAVGNSANASVAAARLGLTSSLIANVGEDHNGKEMIGTLAQEKVSTDYVKINKGFLSNYHYVLWYDVDRTILVKHEQYPYKMPEISVEPEWIYLSSLGENSLLYHQEIAEYLRTHPDVKLVFQPGTFQMKFGTDKLAEIYKRTKLFFCNVQEAQRILNTTEADVKKLLKMVRELGPEIVCITDGIKGAYVYDGTAGWFMGVYPHVPFERTGAGDAFASTFTCAIALGKSIEEALLWAPINSMSVTQKIGAQAGLLTREQLADFLTKAPENYRPTKIM
jgi:ribokinase